ncbi:MAG TPA: carboxypeptidase-like regulatory domain-containing protein [Thermoanaerobaculia bacterium]|nr:carboxypeptidase-like regulatory domain-containing protein [Thermoanaerobaculia bacterium]
MRIRALLTAKLLLTLCFTVPLTAGERPDSPVRIELQFAFKKEAPAEWSGSLTLRPFSGEGKDIVLPVESGTRAELEIPSGSSWKVSSEIPGFWAPASVLTAMPSEGTTVHRIELWPAGRLTGLLKMTEVKQGLPKEIEAAIVSPPDPRLRSEIPKGAVVCPIAEKGVFHCDVPAASLDVALRSPGFVPDYRWGLRVETGKRLSLGTVTLKEGASLTGWVQLEDAGAPLKKGRARLSPLLAPGHEAKVTTRLRSIALEGLVRQDGFFQFAGIAPGHYLLEVEGEGLAPTRIFPLEIRPWSETVLPQPVVLRPPLQLELSISPPLDWLSRPWHVQVRRASDFSGALDGEPAYEGPAGEVGRVKIAGQAPGSFSIQVRDSLGNTLFSTFRRPVERPEDARLDIEIDLVTVSGSVELGKEPLAAQLWFGGMNGVPRVRMDSNAEGEFHGVLPRDGTWNVDVKAEEPRLETHVQVKLDADRAGRAAAEIRLPDTHVFGRVLDEDAKPVAKAQVTVATGVDTLVVTTDETGAFEARAIPEGVTSLAAKRTLLGDPYTSAPVVVPVGSSPVGPVDLHLRKTKIISGKVFSPAGPVAGASLNLLSSQPRLGFGDSARTDVDGTFIAQLPGGTQRVRAVVSPPGYALQAFEFPAGEEPAVLTVSPNGGTLEVFLPFTSEEMRETGLRLLYFQNGVPLAGSTLVLWALSQGEKIEDRASLRFPNLAPGEYQVCLSPRMVLPEAELIAFIEGLEDCASGYLPAAGNLKLELTMKQADEQDAP